MRRHTSRGPITQALRPEQRETRAAVTFETAPRPSQEADPGDPGDRWRIASPALSPTRSSQEIEPALASQPPIVQAPRPAAAPDPTAARIAAAIAERLAARASGSREARVAIGALRNQSRAGAREFAAVTDHLARLLIDAGAAVEGIDFTVDSSAPVLYELRATIYLLRVRGEDVWEIYPAVHLRGCESVIWQSQGPVRFRRPPALAPAPGNAPSDTGVGDPGGGPGELIYPVPSSR